MGRRPYGDHRQLGSANFLPINRIAEDVWMSHRELSIEVGTALANKPITRRAQRLAIE